MSVYLLDTHAFLWWITDDKRLSQRAREIIAEGRNRLLLSAVSGWEIAVKARLGRLSLPGSPEAFVPEQMELNALEPLPILMSHALHVHALPDLHRDPFDRMLVAQAQVEGLPIVTADAQIAQYEVETVW